MYFFDLKIKFENLNRDGIIFLMSVFHEYIKKLQNNFLNETLLNFFISLYIAGKLNPHIDFVLYKQK